jgi:hypothetical protein
MSEVSDNRLDLHLVDLPCKRVFHINISTILKHHESSKSAAKHALSELINSYPQKKKETVLK